MFYKQYPGEVPDVSAFSDIVADAGLRRSEVTVIADKGFESELNEAPLDEVSLGYVLAMRRGWRPMVLLEFWHWGCGDVEGLVDQ